MTRLKDFQRATVGYVMDRYFGTDPTRRFLVADETGMGKSLVAGGIVAELVGRLQRDDSVKRIDIIYICSNQEIAAQNLSQLVPPGYEAGTASSRLTLLGLRLPEIRQRPASGKPVTVTSFTPGTSFDKGWRTGKVEERALIYHLLRHRLLWGENWDHWQRKAAFRILQCTARNLDTFEAACLSFEGLLSHGRFDDTVLNEFRRRAGTKKLIDRFRTLMGDIGRRTKLNDIERELSRQLVAELRGALAEAGAEALQPDLVILDEFQRFRSLLDRERGDEAAELAHHLFDHKAARVLLLSATPYKPFTYAEETTDDHLADLHGVLKFLLPDATWNDAVRVQLAAYRKALLSGAPTGPIREEVRRLLLRVMCRTERPPLDRYMMLTQHLNPADDLDAEEIRSYVAMKRLGVELKAPVLLDYWKSAPYFLNFVEGYLLGSHLQKSLREGPSKRVRELLTLTRLLDPKTIAAFEPISLGNSKLRKLAEQTVGQNWWKLLWLPPSMPYHLLGEPFATAADQGITKRLIFSSWNATPTAVSALLSYDAECRIRQDRPDPPGSRLDYSAPDSRPATMSSLALFWPHPGLAAACDPQQYARSEPDRLMTLGQIEGACRARLREVAPHDLSTAGHKGDRQPWRSAMRWPGALPAAGLTVDRATEVMHDPKLDDLPVALRKHIQMAFSTATTDREPICADLDTALDDLVPIGLHAPGNLAWRALNRLLGESDDVTPQGLWEAAAVIADSFRILFNRAESMLLLDRLDLGVPYWQAVLKYCAAGGLQAVLDEYLHVLRSGTPDEPLDDASLWQLASTARSAIALRPARYAAFDPLDPGNPIRITGRFALRYGGRTNDDEARIDRAGAIKDAFNSPFWPFVVTTTSTGQEGIDFHRYCSAVVHWNVPANPVDFEQREGRVHRFGGHAIRRNVAARHRAQALRTTDTDIWKAAYDAARRTSELGDLVPYWLYPGPASIERHVLPLPLSRDTARYERLQRDLALYRLTFGQPRQEDMLALLSSTAASRSTETIDLRPPSAKL